MKEINNKEKAIRIGTAIGFGLTVLWGTGCLTKDGKKVTGFGLEPILESPTTPVSVVAEPTVKPVEATPVPTASKPVENGITLTQEQFDKLLAQIDAAQKGSGRITGVVTAVPAISAAPKAEPRAESKVEPTQETVKGPKLTEGGKFTVSGLPEKVDPKNVLVANGPDGYGNNFVNTLPFGAEVFAEKGVVKFGPEATKAEIDGAGKSGERYNPSNQIPIITPEGFVPVREGGFTVLNGNNMEIEVIGNDGQPYRINLGGDEVNHTIAVIRGLFPDKQTPKDRNRTVKVFNHPAGHTMADLYPLGAYISSEHMKQMIKNAYTSFPNNGDSGARKMAVFTLDLNTGAWAYYVQSDINGKWDLAGSNWK